MSIYAYRKKATGEYPRFEGDVRLEHPEIGGVFVCPDTYEPVYAGVFPELFADIVAVELPPAEVGGVWVQQFAVTPAPALRPAFSPGGFPQRPKLRRPTGASAIFPTEATGRIEVTRLGPNT
jgi:hypothetical protein